MIFREIAYNGVSKLLLNKKEEKHNVAAGLLLSVAMFFEIDAMNWINRPSLANSDLSRVFY